MTARPDLVDVWVYRNHGGHPEILMLRRSNMKVLPGLWQGVSGGVEPGETIRGAALRELARRPVSTLAICGVLDARLRRHVPTGRRSTPSCRASTSPRRSSRIPSRR